MRTLVLILIALAGCRTQPEPGFSGFNPDNPRNADRITSRRITPPSNADRITKPVSRIQFRWPVVTPIPTQVRTLPVLESPSGEIIYPQIVTSTP